MSDFDNWKAVAEALRVAEFMAGHIRDSAYGRDDIPTKAADQICGDVAVVGDRIRAAIAGLDAIKPGFAALVLQAAHEAEQRAAAMRPHLV